MKILLLFAIFFAVSFASFHPKYTTIKPDYRFVVTEVTVESNLVRGQSNSLKVCAVNNLSSGDFFTGTWYEIGANYGSRGSKTVYETGYQSYIPSSAQPSNSVVCESYDFTVPLFAEDSLYVQLWFAATANGMSKIVINLPL